MHSRKLAAALIVLAAIPLSARAEVILQYFGTSWREIERRMPELAEAGYDSLWLPPPFKAGGGTYSVGYDTLDRFDLGDRHQSGTIRTKYGTTADFVRMMRTAHRFGIRVYFDNVMAHNAGPLGKTTNPGELFPHVPGFVPEDFHIVREADGTWRKPADWPDWQNEWQVLNRNPFSWDIAQESPNVSFNPNGTTEGNSYPKWTGIRHPDRPELYLDTDLVVATNADGSPVHPFSNKEPFEDSGFIHPDTGELIGAGNGRFDFLDLNGNGKHDPGEPSEPFDDSGVDPTVPWRRTAQWGYGDGRYNMGTIVPEDVNQMLFRAVRWFIDQSAADGFRLDAVKHVPAYFFGMQSGTGKDASNAGYIGQIQEQFNITRGFSDWNNHRDTIFNSHYQSRDDAMIFGEHLGAPPAEGPYLEAGMRIANDNLLNAVRNTIGSDLTGYDNPQFGLWGQPNQVANYVMSHDNAWLWAGDRPLAHAHLLARQGLPIIYTDGYNEERDFPKIARVPFLGQFGDNSVISAVAVHRDFARGFQVPRWSDRDFAAFERHDPRENKFNTPAWNTPTMLFMMARQYQPNGQGRLVQTAFPTGATLVNQSPHGGRFRVSVNAGGNVVDASGNPPLVPPGGWFAFTWHNPRMPLVWQDPRHREAVAPIRIYQNGAPAPMMDHWRTDGRDGDPAFNPHGVPAADTAARSYRVRIPRVTDGSNLRIIARADGSADNIRLKLNGGIDVNSQMGFGPQPGDATADHALRDFPPAINHDLFNAGNESDGRLEASTDTYLGYEQMRFVRRTKEKFAASDIARNIIGSVGAEVYQVTIGTDAASITNGSGPDSQSNVPAWILHQPAQPNDGSPAVPQFDPAPQTAAGQTATIWAKVGYQFLADRMWVYYTTDGTTFPEGSGGVGKGSTQVVQGGWNFNAEHDGTAIPDWWSATLPAMPEGTVLRYKIGFTSTQSAPPRFPFSSHDINVAERSETVFEIDGFNADAVKYHVHNDYGTMATGLEEGFHVLRSRAFVGRSDGASIYRTNTQVFYYDTKRPDGIIRFPEANATIGGASYGGVILTDPSVTEVWFNIDDLEPANDNSQNGNGPGNWARATRVLEPTQLGTTGMAREWRFTYSNIPAAGIATIRIRLLEASSSSDMSLSDEDGWFTTLERSVSTGSPLNFAIGFPNTPGELVDANYTMRVFFSKPLLPDSMTDEEFLDEFSIFISSTTSGQSDNPVLQPRQQYSLIRNPEWNDYSVEFTFPDLYNGDPDFLHHIRIQHQRGQLVLGDEQVVRMRPGNTDTSGDGMPDWWKRLHGLDPFNPSGIHGRDGDFDGDGLTNWQEYVAGLNPADPSDGNQFPKLTIHSDEARRVHITYPVLQGRRYRLWWSSDTRQWNSLHNWWWPWPGDTSRTFIDNAPASGNHPHRFYRLKIDMSP